MPGRVSAAYHLDYLVHAPLGKQKRTAAEVAVVW